MSRYKVLEGSESNHCCFEATVIDTDMDSSLHAVCECFSMEEAQMVADALNAKAAPQH